MLVFALLVVHFVVIALGPWTWKLRNYFDPCNYNPEDNPKILIEGPFGGGNQDWYKFEVAVMVGGGIGVTPYASILNDLVFGTSTNRYSGVACKKVNIAYKMPHFYVQSYILLIRFTSCGFAHLTNTLNGSLMYSGM